LGAVRVGEEVRWKERAGGGRGGGRKTTHKAAVDESAPRKRRAVSFMVEELLWGRVKSSQAPNSPYVETLEKFLEVRTKKRGCLCKAASTPRESYAVF
jgi:hypothetical protein